MAHRASECGGARSPACTRAFAASQRAVEQMQVGCWRLASPHAPGASCPRRYYPGAAACAATMACTPRCGTTCLMPHVVSVIPARPAFMPAVCLTCSSHLLAVSSGRHARAGNCRGGKAATRGPCHGTTCASSMPPLMHLCCQPGAFAPTHAAALCACARVTRAHASLCGRACGAGLWPSTSSTLAEYLECHRKSQEIKHAYPGTRTLARAL